MTITGSCTGARRCVDARQSLGMPFDGGVLGVPVYCWTEPELVSSVVYTGPIVDCVPSALVLSICTPRYPRCLLVE
jgi:hypothetical protein